MTYVNPQPFGIETNVVAREAYASIRKSEGIVPFV